MSTDDGTVSTVDSSISQLQQNDRPRRRNHRRSSYNSNMPEVFDLIKKSDWRNLRNALNSQHCYTLCQERDHTQLNCLTMALVTQTPMDIVTRVIQIDRDLLYRRDVYGATPLHVACLNGTSIEKIVTILNYDKQDDGEPHRNREYQASILDNDQRSALHHAVEFVCTSVLEARTKKKSKTPICFWIRHDDEESCVDRDVLDYCFRLISVICDAAPGMVFSKCKHGLTPIDILHVQKVKLFKMTKTEECEEYRFFDKIYNILKRTSISEYKKLKSKWEAEEGKKEIVNIARSEAAMTCKFIFIEMSLLCQDSYTHFSYSFIDSFRTLSFRFRVPLCFHEVRSSLESHL